MISRKEFYFTWGIILLLVISDLISNHSVTGDEEIEKAKINTKDSMIQVQKDSAFARALKFELKADSLQAVVNRKNLDLNIIHKKVENEKKNVRSLGPDSTLSFFERSVNPH